MERKSELDMLRAVSMMGVVALHVLGAIKPISEGTDCEVIINLLLAVLYCSVNVFALLSGYLKVTSGSRTSSIFTIWATTFFWCFVITIVAHFWLTDMSIKQYVGYMIPYIVDRLWYITCYSFAFFMMPYMNKLLETLTKKQLQSMLFILFVLMSIITTFAVKDSFHVVSTGYSAAWLMYLYTLGGYIRLYGFPIHLSKGKLIITLIVNSAFIMLSSVIIKYVFTYLGVNGHEDIVEIFYRYSSPFTLLNSILFLWLIVEYVRIKNNIIIRILTWMSKVSLGVYIIHAHPFSLDYVFTFEHFEFILSAGIVGCVIMTIITVLVVFIICGLAESLREKIFKLLKIPSYINYIGNKVDTILCWNK